jgi:hypothetical protein
MLPFMLITIIKAMTTCGICGRELGAVLIEDHHLVPKTFKGKITVPLHKICHQKLHTVFSERELFNYYHTEERIREHSEMQTFIKWVEKKDPAFYIKSKDTKERNGKRRR